MSFFVGMREILSGSRFTGIGELLAGLFIAAFTVDRFLSVQGVDTRLGSIVELIQIVSLVLSGVWFIWYLVRRREKRQFDEG